MATPPSKCIFNIVLGVAEALVPSPLPLPSHVKLSPFCCSNKESFKFDKGF